MTLLRRWIKAVPSKLQMTSKQAENVRFPCC